MTTAPPTTAPLPDALRLIRADNPSPLTGPGTNSFLVGRGEVAVIDPGPDLPAHQAAILNALEPGERITAILVTHAHIDHSALVPALARATGAPVLAYGTATEGRSSTMAQLAAQGMRGGGEGLDHSFTPDRRLSDGEELRFGPVTLRALHTPGHAASHMAFAADDPAIGLLCGDLVLGWSSTLISPPDGDLTQYFHSLTRLETTLPPGQIYRPAHGDAITDPAARIAELRTHRQARVDAILTALADGPANAATLTRRIYTDTPPALYPAAERNVLASLIALTESGAARPEGDLHAETCFSLVTSEM